MNMGKYSCAGLRHETPWSAKIASWGFTRSAAASLVNWWLTHISPAPDFRLRLDPSMADQWLKRMSMALRMMWRPLSATCVTCCWGWGFWQCHCCQMLHGLGFSSGKSCPSSPPGISCLSCAARCIWGVPTQLCYMVAKHGYQVPLMCKVPTPLTTPWSIGYVAPKTKTKHSRLHYARILPLRISRQSFRIAGLDVWVST